MKKADLEVIRDRLEARWKKYDDVAIGDAWVRAAVSQPDTRVSTHKGLPIIIRRRPDRNRVAYEACLCP